MFDGRLVYFLCTFPNEFISRPNQLSDQKPTIFNIDLAVDGDRAIKVEDTFRTYNILALDHSITRSHRQHEIMITFRGRII